MTARNDDGFSPNQRPGLFSVRAHKHRLAGAAARLVRIAKFHLPGSTVGMCRHCGEEHRRAKWTQHLYEAHRFYVLLEDAWEHYRRGK